MATPTISRPRRTHIPSRLMRESLLDKHVVASTTTETEISILPDVNIILLGGRSVLDRGKAVLFPILQEIVRCRKRHKIVIGVGGGARGRHTYHICLDLGNPLGGMAMVAGAVDEQNTRLVQSLLAKDKGITLNKDHFLDLPLWLEAGMIPIMTGMPPYHYWEPPTGEDIPSHGEDLGMFMVSEVLGARSMIFVKDENGLYTGDPKKAPRARFIPSIEAGDLLKMDLPELIIERTVVQTMLSARHTRQVQIVNGLKPNPLRRALAGEPVGTVIYVGSQNHPAKGLWSRRPVDASRADSSRRSSGRKSRNGR